MDSLSEIIIQFLKLKAIEQSFEIWGKEFSTVGLLYAYAAAAVICLIYVILTLIIGEIADIFSVDDDGAFPAAAIALGVFASFGGLSLFFFEATPKQSLAYGISGGLLMFFFAMLLLRWFSHNQSSMIIEPATFIGAEGTCSLRIRPQAAGQIEVSLKGIRSYLTAYGKEEIPTGARIRIIKVRNGNEVDVETVEEG